MYLWRCFHLSFWTQMQIMKNLWSHCEVDFSWWGLINILRWICLPRNIRIKGADEQRLIWTCYLLHLLTKLHRICFFVTFAIASVGPLCILSVLINKTRGFFLLILAVWNKVILFVLDSGFCVRCSGLALIWFSSSSSWRIDSLSH